MVVCGRGKRSRQKVGAEGIDRGGGFAFRSVGRTEVRPRAGHDAAAGDRVCPVNAGRVPLAVEQREAGPSGGWRRIEVDRLERKRGGRVTVRLPIAPDPQPWARECSRRSASWPSCPSCFCSQHNASQSQCKGALSALRPPAAERCHGAHQRSSIRCSDRRWRRSTTARRSSLSVGAARGKSGKSRTVQFGCTFCPRVSAAWTAGAACTGSTLSGQLTAEP